MKVLPDPDAAVAFLVSLRPRGPWNLCAVVPDGPIASATFTDPSAARAWIAKHADRANLHFTANPAPEPSGKGGRVRKADVPVIEYLHGDFDHDKLPDSHELAGLSLAERKDAVATDMDLADLTPTMLVDTGGGLQGLWRLPEPLPATSDNLEWAEGSNRWLANRFAGGEPECANIDHLLRLPGTINHPNEKKRQRGRTIVATRLVGSTGEVHDLSAFGQVAGSAKLTSDITIGVPEVVTDLDSLAAEYGLPERLVTIIREGRLPEPKQGDDSRSAWLFDLTCGLARRGVPGEVIAGVLLNPEWEISASIYDHPGRPPEEQASREAARALAALAAERQHDVDQMGEHAANSSNRSSRPHRFRLYSVRELLDMPLPVWLVDGLLTEKSLTMIYGDPKAGKTFAALDLTLCIATGRSFHGKDTAPGVVVYVAAENSAAETGRRILAWCRANNIDPDELSGRFYLVISGVVLNDPADRSEFMKHLPAKADVVVFDTLQRNMGGNENETADATAVVKGADTVRRELGAAVVLVHHTGKAGEKERGSTVFRASVDTLLKLKKLSPRKGAKRTSLIVEAQRAAEDGWAMGFELRPVVYDADTLATTMVLRLVEEGTEEEVEAGGMSPQEARAKSARDRMLVEIWRDSPDKQTALVRDDRSKATVTRYLQELRKEGLLKPGTLELSEDGLAHAEALDEIEKINL